MKEVGVRAEGYLRKISGGVREDVLVERSAQEVRRDINASR